MNTTYARRVLVGGAWVWLCLFQAGCGISGPGTQTLREIDRNRERWRQLGLDTYRYAVERICFCGLAGPVRVTVVDGEATERTFVLSGEPVPAEQGEWYPTVDGLFEILFDAVQRDAVSIEVTYDPDTGVPLDIFIDYSRNIADEELGFRVTEVPEDPSALSGG